jgi:hypothetical protein
MRVSFASMAGSSLRRMLGSDHCGLVADAGDAGIAVLIAGSGDPRKISTVSGDA